MVSIDKLTREELTSIIAQELHIDVGFPCFSVEEQTGATACCSQTLANRFETSEIS
ncbi:10122_t:CDS:2 [Diversispora eburnea]|uniref:10122_t:CDS:1 n=1 Tax=Diversispora eburnea TaxID=1213867 RepID=A0A9N8VFE9_9GLOM|nr:10122_t:CDS:2 [Diversispora eburnea]